MVFFPKAYATAARGDFCWQYLSMQAAWCTTSGVILHNHFCKPNVYSKFISDQQLDSKDTATAGQKQVSTISKQISRLITQIYAHNFTEQKSYSQFSVYSNQWIHQ